MFGHASLREKEYRNRKDTQVDVQEKLAQDRARMPRNQSEEGNVTKSSLVILGANVSVEMQSATKAAPTAGVARKDNGEVEVEKYNKIVKDTEKKVGEIAQVATKRVGVESSYAKTNALGVQAKSMIEVVVKKKSRKEEKKEREEDLQRMQQDHFYVPASLWGPTRSAILNASAIARHRCYAVSAAACFHRIQERMHVAIVTMRLSQDCLSSENICDLRSRMLLKGEETCLRGWYGV